MPDKDALVHDLAAAFVQEADGDLSTADKLRNIVNVLNAHNFGAGPDMEERARTILLRVQDYVRGEGARKKATAARLRAALAGMRRDSARTDELQ